MITSLRRRRPPPSADGPHAARTGDAFARISVVDNSPGLSTTYDHVLLADPYGAGSTAGPPPATTTGRCR
ncbi:hypothetical protein [Streptosporangium sandarakinum]|uniref:hypothetical protein n=1 Tax=Streptosporangium sandarakinum TaxID=1260955 RepID=UPI0033A84D12